MPTQDPPTHELSSMGTEVTSTYQPYESEAVLPARVLRKESLGGKVSHDTNASDEGKGVSRGRGEDGRSGGHGVQVCGCSTLERACGSNSKVLMPAGLRPAKCGEKAFSHHHVHASRSDIASAARWVTASSSFRL